MSKQHITRSFRNVPPSQSLNMARKKLNLTQQKPKANMPKNTVTQKLNLVNVVSASLVHPSGTVFHLICMISQTLKRLKNDSRVCFQADLFVTFYSAPERFVEQSPTNLILYCTANI